MGRASGARRTPLRCPPVPRRRARPGRVRGDGDRPGPAAAWSCRPRSVRARPRSDLPGTQSHVEVQSPVHGDRRASRRHPEPQPAVAQADQHGDRDRQQNEAQDDGRLEPALQQQVHLQRDRLGPAREVAGEGDRRPELAEGPGPASTAPAARDGRDQRQCDPAEDRPAAGAERAGRVLVSAVGRPKRGLGGDHEERHGHERLGQHRPGRRERQLIAEPLVEPLAEQARGGRRPAAGPHRRRPAAAPSAGSSAPAAVDGRGTRPAPAPRPVAPRPTTRAAVADSEHTSESRSAVRTCRCAPARRPRLPTAPATGVRAAGARKNAPRRAATPAARPADAGGRGGRHARTRRWPGCWRPAGDARRSTKAAATSASPSLEGDGDGVCRRRRSARRGWTPSAVSPADLDVGDVDDAGIGLAERDLATRRP